MPNIVSFIGWHNSGKTTLAAIVVQHLKRLGYRVAVIKSSKTSGISFDTPGTDTAKHREAGADSVLFVAPDQMVLFTDNNQDLTLPTLAHRYFPDVDIIIGEGFKEATSVAKIEVVRDPEQILRKKVSGVIAIATDQNISGDYIFKLDEGAEIASFIEKRFLQNNPKKTEKTALLINGRKIPLKEFVQDSLAGTIAGLVQSLKLPEEVQDIELRITIKPDKP